MARSSNSIKVCFLIATASCDSGRSKPPPPPPPAPVADAAVLADAALPPPDAAPPPAIDVRPSVRAAAPWIGQKRIEEPKIGEDTLITYELRRDGDQALLTRVGGTTSMLRDRPTADLEIDGSGVLRAVPSKRTPPPPPVPKEWRLSVVEKGKTLTFSMLDGSDQAPLTTCTRTTLAVVRADAELDVKNEDDCGSEPFWKPATTKRVTVLSCGEEFAFAAAPGIEWYYHHGDCFQGGGWRALPKE